MLITSLDGGGAERAVSVLSTHLNQNISSEVILLSGNNISYPTRSPPISLNVITSNFKNKHIDYVKYLLLGAIRYRRIIKRYNPDCSMSFLVLDNFINLLSNLGSKNTTTIISVHTALSKKFQKSSICRVYVNLVKLLYRRADIVIAVSEGVKQELIEEYGIIENKVHVIYNPIDSINIKILSLECVEDEPWYHEDIPVVITVGRLSVAKGHWHLIRAFKKVVNETKCRLLICGDGDLKPYLQNLINDLNLNDYIKLAGWKHNPYKYMSRSEIYVLSSLWEALPYALIEAMTCGCPIISTDCDYGPAEILDGGKYGVLIPTPDGSFYDSNTPLTAEEDKMARAILNFLNKQSLRKHYSNLAEKRSTDFDFEDSLIKYENLILK